MMCFKEPESLVALKSVHMWKKYSLDRSIAVPELFQRWFATGIEISRSEGEFPFSILTSDVNYELTPRFTITTVAAARDTS